MGTGSKKTSNYGTAALLFLVLFLLQFLFSRLGFYVSRSFDYWSVDPDGIFAQVSVHHIIQMLCAIAAILIIRKVKKIEGFKLRPRFDPKGIKYTKKFLAYESMQLSNLILLLSLDLSPNDLNTVLPLDNLEFLIVISLP